MYILTHTYCNKFVEEINKSTMHQKCLFLILLNSNLYYSTFNPARCGFSSIVYFLMLVICVILTRLYQYYNYMITQFVISIVVFN